MADLRTNDLKSGLKLVINGEPCVVLESEFNKPGKGQAYNKVKFRNLKTGRVLEKTYKSSAGLTIADVTELCLQYLYNDGGLWYFMDQQSFEQYSVDKDSVADAARWLKNGVTCTVIYWNDEVLSILPPNFVVLAVTETDPGVKGDTVTGAQKLATLETGTVIKVPLFIVTGEEVKIDTRTGEYAGRARE